MVRPALWRRLALRRAGLGVAALGFALVPVVLVGGPAQALSPGVGAGFRNFELRELPDVYAGETQAERAANMDAGRNSAGLAEGTASPLAVPAASAAASRWANVGGTASSLFSAAMFMPLIFQVGDALTSGYVSQQAQADCALPDSFFGALSKWAAGVAGYACDQSAKPDGVKDPGYLPQYKGQAGPAGFPATIVAPTYGGTYGGSVTWGTPYWSTQTFASRDGTGHSFQEGWVYPVNWSGSYYSAIGPPEVYVTLLQRAADGSVTSTRDLVGTRSSPGVGSTGSCAAQLCVSVTRLGEYVVGDASLEAGGDYAISAISGDTGAGRVNTVPVTPPTGYSVAAGAGAPSTTGTGAQVKLRTTLTDTKGETASCDTASFIETDTVIPKPCEPALPSDWGVLANRTVEIVPSTSDAPTVIQNVDTSPGYQTQQTQYPQCSTQVCLLTLTKIAGSPTGECSDFSTDPNPCADWFTDPSKASDYECEYAGSVVSLDECGAAYARLYKPGAIAQGTAYPSTDPGVDPGADPGVQTSKPPATDTGPSTVTPPSTSGEEADCFPTGWGVFNPAEWVLKPVKCALVWAFVPPADSMTAVRTQLDTAIAGTPLGQVDGLVSGITGPFLSIGSAGCQGPPLRFLAFGVDQTFYPMDACSEPLAGTASFVSGALGFSVVALSTLSITRYIAGTIGFVGFATTRMRDSTAGESAGKS